MGVEMNLGVKDEKRDDARGIVPALRDGLPGVAVFIALHVAPHA
jgi:hypothetical protein